MLTWSGIKETPLRRNKNRGMFGSNKTLNENNIDLNISKDPSEDINDSPKT